MAISEIVITDFIAVGAANQINLQWGIDDPHVGGLPYLQFDHAEVRYADAIDMASPTTLTTAASYSFNHLQVLPGASYYYQVRAVDRSGQFGEWCDPVLGEEAAIDSSAISTPWVDFTPTVVAGSGTFGSYTSSGRYKQVGLLMLFSMEFELTSVGSGTILIRVKGIPNEAALSGSASGYYESAGASVAVAASLFADVDGTSYVDVFKHDGTSPIAANKPFAITGQFEIGL